MLTRDDLIREARQRGGSLPALLLVYASLIGAMVLSACAII